MHTRMRLATGSKRILCHVLRERAVEKTVRQPCIAVSGGRLGVACG